MGYKKKKPALIQFLVLAQHAERIQNKIRNEKAIYHLREGSLSLTLNYRVGTWNVNSFCILVLPRSQTKVFSGKENNPKKLNAIGLETSLSFHPVT